MQVLAAEAGLATTRLFRDDCALISRALAAAGFDVDGDYARQLARSFDLLVKLIDLAELAGGPDGSERQYKVDKILASDHAWGEHAYYDAPKGVSPVEGIAAD